MLARSTLLLALCAPSSDVVLEWRVESGTELTKVWESCLEWRLQEPIGYWMNVHDAYSLREERIEVVDRYFEVDDGDVRGMNRTFRTLERRSQDEWLTDKGLWDVDGVRSSVLEGHTVRFSREPGRGSYEASFVGDRRRCDDDFLDGLAPDMDLRGFLPDGAVAVGDTWEVPSVTFLASLRPGGVVSWEIDDRESKDPFPIHEAVGEWCDGAGVKATLRKLEEDGHGHRLARIELLIDATTRSEQGFDCWRAFGIEPREGLTKMDVTAVEEREWLLEGELVWDVDRGRATRLALEGDIRVTSRVETGAIFYGSFTLVVQRAGTYRCELRVDGC